MRHNARRRFEKLQSYIEGGSLLDVGAAEGWVGEWAQVRTGIRVELVDVVDLNRTDLPHTVYDGRNLPLPDNSYDTVTLLLALHHCADPERVLAEAVRVARKRVIITESVYRTRPGRAFLTLLEGGFNRVRAKGIMPPALHFKTVVEWRRSFARQGFACIHEAWLSRGFHEQRLFVLKAPLSESIPAGFPEEETNNRPVVSSAQDSGLS
jgi:SAM-dependent methyltransferase